MKMLVYGKENSYPSKWDLKSHITTKMPCFPNTRTGNTAEIINETLAGNIQFYNKSSVIQELHDFGNIFGVFAGIDPVVIVIVRNKRTVC